MTFKLTERQQEAENLLFNPAKYILLAGGSRSGKTAAIVYFQLCAALMFPNSKHLIARLHLSDLRSAIIDDTLPKIASLISEPLGLYVKSKFNNSTFNIKFHNGSSIWFGGVADKERSEKILGNEYLTIFLNEISQIKYDVAEKVFTRAAQKIEGCRNRIFFDCNPPTKGHWGYKLFIKHEDPIDKRQKKASNYAYLLMNPKDNPHLPSEYMETLDELSEKAKARFRDGVWQDDTIGALWSQDTIDMNRTDKRPPDYYQRIIIAVDPAVSADEESDETGIVVVGAKKDTAYVLEDATGVYEPDQWASVVKHLYDKWEADKIIAEVNQGGDLVESNIRAEDKNLPVKKIRAYKGKYVRAEPVANLYEQGRVKHAGVFHELEEQQTSWVPMTSSKSPDRVDATVYGVTELLLNKVKAKVYRWDD